MVKKGENDLQNWLQNSDGYCFLAMRPSYKIKESTRLIQTNKIIINKSKLWNHKNFPVFLFSHKLNRFCYTLFTILIFYSTVPQIHRFLRTFPLGMTHIVCFDRQIRQSSACYKLSIWRSTRSIPVHLDYSTSRQHVDALHQIIPRNAHKLIRSYKLGNYLIDREILEKASFQSYLLSKSFLQFRFHDFHVFNRSLVSLIHYQHIDCILRAIVRVEMTVHIGSCFKQRAFQHRRKEKCGMPIGVKYRLHINPQSCSHHYSIAESSTKFRSE